MKNKPLVKSLTRYTSSNIYQRVCGIINTFIKPRLLSPDLYGIWNILSLVATYATYLHLGSRNSMFYRIPYAKGKEDHGKAAAIEASTFYGSLAVTLVAVAGVLLYAVFREQTDAVRIGLFVIAGLILLNWYFDFYFVYLIAHQDFMLPSRMNYLKATIAVFLNAVLIYFFSIYGLYLAALLTVLFGVAVFRKVRPLEFRSGFHFGTFRELVAGGMPVMLYNITNELVSTSDKVIVAYFLGSEQLGFYAITGLVFNFLMQIPGDARDVIEPDLMRGADHRTPEANLAEYFFKPLAYTGALMPFLIGPAVFCAPVFIHLLLPRYLPGILPTQIIVLGSYFFALAYVARGIIVAYNGQVRAALIISAVVLLNIVLGILLIKAGFGLAGVATGSSVSFLVLFVALCAFIRKRHKGSASVWSAAARDVVRPFVFIVTAIALLEAVSRMLAIHEIATALLKTGIFLAASYGLLAYTGKRSPSLQGMDVRKLFKRKG